MFGNVTVLQGIDKCLPTLQKGLSVVRHVGPPPVSRKLEILPAKPLFLRMAGSRAPMSGWFSAPSDTLEADTPRWDIGFKGGSRHDAADEIVSEEMQGDFIAHALRRSAAELGHLQHDLG